jgi:hypothetical protein
MRPPASSPSAKVHMFRSKWRIKHDGVHSAGPPQGPQQPCPTPPPLSEPSPQPRDPRSTPPLACFNSEPHKAHRGTCSWRFCVACGMEQVTNIARSPQASTERRHWANSSCSSEVRARRSRSDSAPPVTVAHSLLSFVGSTGRRRASQSVFHTPGCLARSPAGPGAQSRIRGAGPLTHRRAIEHPAAVVQ